MKVKTHVSSVIVFVLFSLHILASSLFGITADFEVLIPMRDGVLLPTRLFVSSEYLDMQQEKSPRLSRFFQKQPVVLIRNPLGNERIDPSWIDLTKHGYVVAVQSTRSCLDRTGMALPYITDGQGSLQDGYDTVEWLAQSEFCNGKVATIGESALGITQLLMAPTHPPHLVCQYIELAAPSLYHYAVWPGGQFRKEQVEGWLKAHRRDPSIVQFLRHSKEYDPFWQQFNVLHSAHEVEAAQLHLGGWYDIFVQGTIDAFSAVHNAAADIGKPSMHKLIIGPWGHRYRHSKNLGDFPAPDYTKNGLAAIIYKDWLDFHLKGEKNHVTAAPPVQYFVMGPFDGSPSSGNVWKSSDSWPLKGTQERRYCFQPGRKLKTAKPDGTISDGCVRFQVTYDKDNPVPTHGGRNLFLPDGPKDLKAIEMRQDVVVFTTEPLENDLEVTGRLGAKIHLSGVTAARDVCVKLCDVYPDDRSILIAEGLQHITPAGVQTDIQSIHVDMWSTSIVFAKGHRIRCVVSASNYPAYDTALDGSSGGHVSFLIHADQAHPSCLLLPCVLIRE